MRFRTNAVKMVKSERRRSRHVPQVAAVLTLLLTTLLCTSPSAALSAGTASGDAGSGRDAGDVAPLAIEVTSGLWHGRLADPVDRSDWYRLMDVSNGSRVRVTLDSAHAWPLLQIALRGPSTGPADDQPSTYRRATDGATFVAPVAVAGPWYLQVSRLATPVSGHDLQVPYAITLAVEPAPDLRHHVAPATATAGSIRWDEPSHLATYLRSETPVDPTRPEAGLLMMEYDVVRQGRHVRDFFAISFATGGTGTASWEITSHTTPPEHDAGLRADVHLATTQQTMAVYVALSWPDTAGTLRWTAYSTAPGTTTSMAASVGPHSAWVADPDPPVGWTTDGTVTDQPLVRGPALRSVDESTTKLETGQRFIGIFDPHGATGHAVSPDGTRFALDETQVLFLIAPTDGTWTFRMDPHQNAGREAVTTYLHGVRAPLSDPGPGAAGPLPA